MPGVLEGDELKVCGILNSSTRHPVDRVSQSPFPPFLLSVVDLASPGDFVKHTDLAGSQAM